MQFKYRIVESSSAIFRGEEGYIFRTTEGKVGAFKQPLNPLAEFNDQEELLAALAATEGMLDDVIVMGEEVYVTRHDVLEDDSSKTLTRHFRIRPA